MRHALAIAALAACHATPPPAIPAPASGLTAHVTIAPGTKGTLFVTWLTTDELAALGKGEPPMMLLRDLVTRGIVAGEVGARTSVPVTLHPPHGPIVAMAVLDTDHTGLAAIFGGGGSRGMSKPVEVANVAVDTAAIELVASPAPPHEEQCKGDRLELVHVDAPEVAGTVGNPTSRRACVRLPMRYADHPELHYPVIYALPGLLSGDDAVAGYHLDPAQAFVVAVDTSTKTGSTYFVDGPTSGKWDTFFTKDLVPYIDAHYRTIPARTARALVGHSTGAFNAVSLGFRHPDLFGVIGAASPDGLDLENWIGAPRPWIREFARVERGLGGAGQMISYAADWSPTAGGYDWPFDASGALVGRVMRRWFENSPITWLKDPRRVATLKAFSGKVYLAVGDTDEFDLHDPTVAFAAALTAAGIANRLVVSHGGHVTHVEEHMAEIAKFCETELDGAR